VSADVGGNLSIESQQDNSTFEQEQTSTGFSASIGYSTDTSLSLSRSELKANASYQAIQEQSGIIAGDGGFDINVGNNTNLKGALIVSSADKENNSLSTESLSTESIENVTEYDIKNRSIRIDGGKSGSDNPFARLGGDSAKLGLGGGGSASDSDRQTNTTFSAISEGTIDIRNGDASALADTKQTQAEAHTILGNNFTPDKVQEVQEQTEIQKLAGKLVGEAVGDFAQTYLDDRDQLRNEANASTNPKEKARLLSEADAIDKQWGETSHQRRFITAALSGAVGGNIVENLQSTLTDIAGETLADRIGDAQDELSIVGHKA